MHRNLRTSLIWLCLPAYVFIAQCKPIPKTSLFLINKTGVNVAIIDSKDLREMKLVDGVEIEFGQDLILKIKNSFYSYSIPFFGPDFTSTIDQGPKMGMPNYAIVDGSCHLLFTSDLSSVSDLVNLSISQPAPFPLIASPKNTVEETKKELEMGRSTRARRP